MLGSAASAEQYVGAGPGKYVEYQVNTSWKQVANGVAGNESYWDNFTQKLSMVSIFYGSGYTEMNITDNITNIPTSNPPPPTPHYYSLNISNEENSLNYSLYPFLTPGGFISLLVYPTSWPQINNTTLAELNDYTFSRVTMMENVPNLNVKDIVYKNGTSFIPNVNVSTFVSEGGKTTFKTYNGSVNADKILVTQDYSYIGNYSSFSNLTSVALVDSNTGILVYGSQHVELITKQRPYIESNGTAVHLSVSQYSNSTINLVKTNFPLSYTSPPYDLYIVIGLTATIILVATAIFAYRRKKSE